MQPTNQSSDLRTLQILHFALLMGPTLFLLIALYLISSGNFTTELGVYTNEILMGMILLAVVVVLFSNYNFKNKIEQLKSNGLPPEKNMEIYLGAHITRWATIEFAELLSIIFFLLTANYYLLFIIIGLLFYSFSIRPTEDRISEDLGQPYLQ